jgi:hypothetical protein
MLDQMDPWICQSLCIEEIGKGERPGPRGRARGRRPTRCSDQTETVNKQNGDRSAIDRHNQSVSVKCVGNSASSRNEVGTYVGSACGRAPGSG